MKRGLVSVVAVCLLVAGCGGTKHYGGRTHSKQFLHQVQNPPQLPQNPFLSVTSELRGYDSVTTSAVPYGANVAACYASGPYANCSAMAGRHPQHLITIATYYGAVGQVLDTEPGDAVPSQDPGFIRYMRARGVSRPGIYASASEMGSVRYYLNAAGIPRSEYWLWVASWDHNPSIPGGYDAKQWASSSTVDWDTFGSWLFAPPKPPAPPPDPYRFYDKTKRRLPSKQTASEYSTVKTWDKFKCTNPVKRPTCKSTHWHLQLLRDRDVFVAHHVLKNGKWVTVRTPRYGVDHLGDRIRGLQNRIHATKPCSVKTC